MSYNDSIPMGTYWSVFFRFTACDYLFDIFKRFSEREVSVAYARMLRKDVERKVWLYQRVISSRKSKMDRQHNDQKKKDE